MAIFPNIETDKVVQVNDKFRIWASKSYVAKGTAPISKVEIQPEGSVGFIDVTSVRQDEWFLDYQYSDSGSKAVKVRLTSGVSPNEEVAESEAQVSCITSADDKLLSDDSDLVVIESKILNWMPKGRSSFNYAHREAQRQILEWLWVNGYRRTDNKRLTKDEILDIEEFRFWSKYATLRIIFNDISNATNDIFSEKAKAYENTEFLWRNRAILRVDRNSDGVLDDLEGFDMNVRSLIRE